MSRWTTRISVLFLVVLLLAGCFGKGGAKGKSEPAYKGEFKSFELYLFPLANQGGGNDRRWELYPGAKVEAWAFSPDNDPAHATIPGPEIRVREGDTVEITFIISGAPMPHTIHWHGVHVPWDQDGVPYLSQAPLGAPQFGGNGVYTYTYSFPVHQSGTYWYHCHVDTQHHLDMGMYGAFIVEPADPDQDPHFDQEKTLFFDEWDKSHIHSNFAPDQILPRSGQPDEAVDNLYSQLRDYYQMSTLSTIEQVYGRVRNDSTVPQPVRDFLAQNKPSVLRENRTWYPVTYPAYYADYDTFLINGKAFPLTEPILVDNGKTLRLRLVNAGSLVHSIHLHGHHFKVTHKDGYLLPNPYMADTVLIAPGERYDIYVELNNPGPWMLHDHMPQNEQNDHINPGGMMTHLCYREGWALATLCNEKAHPQHPLTSGDILEGTTEFFAATQRAGVDPTYVGVDHSGH
jgi:plastocyanin